MRLGAQPLWLAAGVVVAACGTSRAVTDDAGPPDSVSGDPSTEPRDGGPLRPRPAVAWQATVHTTRPDANGGRDPDLHGLLAVDDGVLVIGTPELVLYADDSAERARTALPAWDGARWHPNASAVLADGTIAILYTSFDARSIGLYDGTTLELRSRRPLDRRWVLMANASGALFVVSADDDVWELHEPASPGWTTRRITGAPAVSPGYYAVGLDNGHVLACARRRDVDRPALVDIDTADATMSVVALSTSGPGAHGCQLYRAGAHVVARWIESEAGETRSATALHSGADGAPIAGPVRQREPIGEPAGVGFDGQSYVGMDDTGTLTIWDATTLEPKPAHRMDLPDDATVGFYGAGFAGGATHSYAAIGYAIGFGPVVQIVQRLAPLP